MRTGGDWDRRETLLQTLSPVAMHIERLQQGHQGPLCTGYHQVVSDGAAASRSQDRGWGGVLEGE